MNQNTNNTAPLSSLPNEHSNQPEKKIPDFPEPYKPTAIRTWEEGSGISIDDYVGKREGGSEYLPYYLSNEILRTLYPEGALRIVKSETTAEGKRMRMVGQFFPSRFDSAPLCETMVEAVDNLESDAELMACGIMPTPHEALSSKAERKLRQKIAQLLGIHPPILSPKETAFYNGQPMEGCRFIVDSADYDKKMERLNALQNAEALWTSERQNLLKDKQRLVQDLTQANRGIEALNRDNHKLMQKIEELEKRLAEQASASQPEAEKKEASAAVAGEAGNDDASLPFDLPKEQTSATPEPKSDDVSLPFDIPQNPAAEAENTEAENIPFEPAADNESDFEAVPFDAKTEPEAEDEPLASDESAASVEPSGFIASEAEQVKTEEDTIEDEDAAVLVEASSETDNSSAGTDDVLEDDADDEQADEDLMGDWILDPARLAAVEEDGGTLKWRLAGKKFPVPETVQEALDRAKVKAKCDRKTQRVPVTDILAGDLPETWIRPLQRALASRLKERAERAMAQEMESALLLQMLFAQGLLNKALGDHLEEVQQQFAENVLGADAES